MAPLYKHKNNVMSNKQNDKQSAENGGAIGKPAVMGRPSYSLDEVKRRMGNSSFFFPSDIYPHSQRFKRWCNSMAKQGHLVKSSNHGRWGYTYSFPACP